MRFLDTNLLLRYFTKENEKKAEAVLELLKRVERNEEKVLTNPLVIFETIYTLQSYYKVSREEIRDLLMPILNLRGLRLDFRNVFEEALKSYPETNISFVDLFNYHFMLKHGVNEIYSSDKDFDKLKGIKRVTPQIGSAI